MMILTNTLVSKSLEIVVYVWVYTNFHLVNLPWDSPVTWWVAFIGVDFGYYWFHRAAHEVNIIWAAHQAHHSSEYYNLSTALRQSSVLSHMLWFIYLPLALFLPPPMYLMHQQFNLLYQFWIHTEVINTLGPLEWVLNTPSHHRVHHGRNPYCIDRNYAGVLIIWDRMFGTFEPEKDERIVYGLVHPLNSWNPLWVQFHHFIYLFRVVLEHDQLSDKLSLLFKGPGWSPGKPRLGYREDIPLPMNKKPYDRKTPLWLDAYIVLHFVIVIVLSLTVGEVRTHFHPLISVAVIIFLICSLTNFALILEYSPCCLCAEVTRLAVLAIAGTILFYCFFYEWKSVFLVFSVVAGTSLGFWSVQLLRFGNG